MFFQPFFFILNLVRGFPLLEFFNTVIPTQIFLQSRNPHPASRIPHPVIPMGTSIGILHPLHTMELRQRRRWGQGERQWTNRFWLEKTCIRTHASGFFAHFFAVTHDYKVKIHSFTFCRGREHKTTVFSSFSRTLKQSFRIQLQRSLPTFDELNQIRWNKRDKVWGGANSLFKCRFRNHRRRCCLKVM